MLSPLFAALIFGAGATFAPASDEAEEARRVESGEIVTTTREVPGRPIPVMKVMGVVKAPPAKVWPIIEDCASYVNTMPRILESEELERNGNQVRCRIKLDMPFPFADLWSETDAVLTIRPGRFYRREWKLRKGDFRANSGSWTLVPHNQGAFTLATYEALTEPNVAIPKFIVEIAQKVTLPSVIERLREHAE